MAFEHKSVLLTETIEGLQIRPDGIYVDGTLGGGGHSYEIAKRLTDGRLIGIDQDQAAIEAAGMRLSPFGDKVTIVRSNYRNTREVLSELGTAKKFPDSSLSEKSNAMKWWGSRPSIIFGIMEILRSPLREARNGPQKKFFSPIAVTQPSSPHAKSSASLPAGIFSPEELFAI